jgi:hypothetical protein
MRRVLPPIPHASLQLRPRTSLSSHPPYVVKALSLKETLGCVPNPVSTGVRHKEGTASLRDPDGNQTPISSHLLEPSDWHKLFMSSHHHHHLLQIYGLGLMACSNSELYFMNLFRTYLERWINSAYG